MYFHGASSEDGFFANNKKGDVTEIDCTIIKMCQRADF